MVAPLFQITLDETITEALSIRGRREVFKAANYAAARVWRDEMLKRHFESGAATRYGYTHRAKSTIEKKKRLAKAGIVKEGGRRPLVHTGLLRRSMSKFQPIRATPGKATINLVGPSYFRISYRPGRPNLGAEVTRIIPQELRRLDEAAMRAADEVITKTKPKRKRVV